MASPYLRKLAGYVLHNRYGRAYDEKKWGPKGVDIERRLLYPAIRELRALRAYGVRKIHRSKDGTIGFTVKGNQDDDLFNGEINVWAYEPVYGKGHNYYRVTKFFIANDNSQKHIGSVDVHNEVDLGPAIFRLFSLNNRQPQSQTTEA